MNIDNFFQFFGGRSNAAKIDYISKRYYNVLTRYANRVLKDLEQSKNVVNEAFVAAFKERDSFTSTKAIWFFLIRNINHSRNACVVERNQNEQVKKLILSKENENYQVTKEVLQAVLEEVESLPWRRRRIFRLFFCGLNPDEVAEMVQRSRKTVINEKNIASNVLLEALRKRNLLFV